MNTDNVQKASKAYKLVEANIQKIGEPAKN